MFLADLVTVSLNRIVVRLHELFKSLNHETQRDVFQLCKKYFITVARTDSQVYKAGTVEPRVIITGHISRHR
jgi:hypothetical protein